MFMDINNAKIGFIGAGYMGEGIAHNLLNNKLPLSVIAHKNRIPIERLIEQGAHESKSLEELASFSNTIIMCVTNTPVATQVVKDIFPYLKPSTNFIDITTHHSTGSIEVNNLLKSKDIRM